MQLRSSLKTDSSEYKENYKYNQKLSSTLLQLEETVLAGGPARAKAHLKKQGKLSARERIEKLCDEDTSFLELSLLAGHELYDSPVPAGALITGVGQVSGRLCMIVANDPSVKGGTYFPITVKKHLRAQEIAEKNHLPCLYLVDSGGAFLPKQDEVFPDRDHFGRIFYNQARLSSKGIAQIASVHGFCTAGGAYIPAMADQTIIVNKTGSIFLGGPPLVKAATGEEVSVEELGGAKVHTSISGVADHLAEDDEDAVQILRQIVRHLGAQSKASLNLSTPKEPLYPQEELLGLLPRDLSKFFDMREVLARLCDASEFFEFKKNFAPTLLTGFSSIGGWPIGVLANNGILFSESALKGTHFIQMCCQEKIPILFLQNISGFMIGKKYEHEGIAKHGAKLVHAVANASVPKLTLIVGGSYGAGNYGMCGRAYDPNFLFTWPRSRISVMGGKQAADVLVSVKKEQLKRAQEKLSQSEEEKMRQAISSKYTKESHAFYASSRLWDDGVLHPLNTRGVLQQALAACAQRPWDKSQFGIFRM